MPGWDLFINPTIDGNTCNVFFGSCSKLSLVRVEELIGFALPSGTEVIESGSTDFLFAKSFLVLIELPGPDLGSTLASAGYMPAEIPTRSFLLDKLDEVGATQRVAYYEHGRHDVLVGIDSEGRVFAVMSYVN